MPRDSQTLGLMWSAQGTSWSLPRGTDGMGCKGLWGPCLCCSMNSPTWRTSATSGPHPRGPLHGGVAIPYRHCLPWFAVEPRECSAQRHVAGSGRWVLLCMLSSDSTSQVSITQTYLMLMDHGSLSQASVANYAVLDIRYLKKTLSASSNLKGFGNHRFTISLPQCTDEETGSERENAFPRPCSKTVKA